jgi:hypothetical protein
MQVDSFSLRESRMNPTNLAFLRIAKRAERQEDDVLTKTFVDFGSVMTVISAVDHQLIYGRRGTGKTHLLTVLRQNRKAAGEIVVQLDMRNLGSAGGIYSDGTIPLQQRATRLLIDVLAAIHERLFEQAIENDALINLGVTGQFLDELFLAHSAVKVVGNTTVEAQTSSEKSGSYESKISLAASTVLNLNAEAKDATSEKTAAAAKRTDTGHEVSRVNFGNVGNALRKITESLPQGKLWILLDEWSEVPLDLQPYLADLLRRAVLPTRGITVKIPDMTIGNVGLEIGADLSASVNLDDYMVFDNDEQKAVTFFKSLVLKHVQAALEGENVTSPSTESALIAQGFTQANAFDEVVRACEGVPRDAIHILGHAAQSAGDSTISVNQVRAAAQQWYQASKDAAVNAHEQARALLQWTVDKVIKERQTKAFLLESGTRDQLIDFLYDERVLHVLRKGMSAQDQPGKRFHVYGIDYGCYVDLINTNKAPKGVLDLGMESTQISVNVPKTDFRSIRRCVLDLADFYKQPSLKLV